MRCHYLSLAALYVAGALASASFEDSIRADFRMALLAPRQATQNLQVFSGALGGVKASAITQSTDPTRPFEVDGDTFVSLG